MTENNKEVQTTEVKGTVEVAPAKKPENKDNNNSNRRFNNNNKRFGNNKKGGQRRGAPRRMEFEERVVDIARVTNVVKGGRRFSFSTIVVIGDKKGKVAIGHGKAKEVPDSIKKAIKDARRNLITVPIVDGTIPHITQAKFVSSNVMLKPAPKGKGIIASGAVRAVVELAGYSDIVTKSLGSSNKQNAVKATLKALSQLKTAKEIASLRDLKEDHFA